MKKIISLLLVALLATTSSLAEDISVERALQIASQFSSGTTATKARMRRAPGVNPTPKLAHAMKSRVAASKDNVYVINFGNDLGFVIVSAEDGADDVLLGYCDHGSFDYSSCPVQMKELLDSYSDAVDSLRQQTTRQQATPRKALWKDLGSVLVGPLLTTTWSQLAPYNNLCPIAEDGGMTYYGGRCPSGCVPTAFAQIMNYWKWPKQSQGKLANPVTGIFDGEDFSGHVYDWDNMLDDYGSLLEGTRYNAAQADAVAKLMADIGKAFGTSYSPTGSSTYIHSAPLSFNFGYDDIEQYSGGTAAELQGKMKSELDLLRPVFYSGYPAGDGEGHALVCDGYTSNNYFHYNYGWGGYCDGWYKNALVQYYPNKSLIFTGIRPVEAVNKVIDDIEYNLCKNGEAQIVQYTLSKVNDVVLVIPDEVTDDEGNVYRVTTIRKHAFYGRGNFDKITIGGNIKSINPYSFISSTIDTLVIGDKMEEVPDNAFQLTQIQHLTIGASVKRIGKQAFRFCRVGTVISRSPGFEVDDEAFFEGGSGGIDTAWYGCITKLGSRVWAGLGPTFPVMPEFTQLREIKKEAFYSIRFPANSEFHVLPALKTIHPGAFVGSNLRYFKVDDDNPYYSKADYSWGTERSILYNKTKTSIIAALPTFTMMGSLYYNKPYPESVVKLEPGSISPAYADGSSAQTFIIPKTVVEMEGAFTECYNLYNLICLAPVPPVVSDTTFNEKLWNFRVSNRTARLKVPVGSEELYRKAPGWRQFSTIEGVTNENASTPYDMTPPQGREYYMVVNYTDEEGGHRVNVPVSEVGNMKLDVNGKQFVIARQGKQDLTIDVAQVDSISWKLGFVYDSAEVFELNDSTLTAQAKTCTVKFDATVIDDDAQLSVRSAVLTPNVMKGITKSVGIDLNLLTSEGEIHELTGTAEITIPIEVGEGETLHAAYFNEESGQWDPVCFTYDEQQGAAVITTSHLSDFEVFCSICEETLDEHLILLWSQCPNIMALDDACKKLLKIVSSDDPNDEMIRQYKDEMMFWKTLGLDIVWSAVSGVGDPLGFAPEKINNAVEAMGYLGTAISILDVVGAAIKGDDAAVASGTLNTILSHASGTMASAIGTPIMSASMAVVAFIGVALNKFGTAVQDFKLNYLRRAYNFYYSKEGYSIIYDHSKWVGDGKHGHFRTATDWYKYFYPAFAEGRMSEQRLNAYIEQSVRRYCDRFWEDNPDAQEAAYTEVKKWGFEPSFPSDLAAEREKISNEYYAELMNGMLVSVFAAIRTNIKEQANNRYQKAANDLAAIVNTNVVLRFSDSSRKKDEKSKYAGWRVAFTEIPEKFGETKLCQSVVSDEGFAEIGPFTEYAFVKHKMKNEITLYNKDGVAQKTFTFSLPDGIEKQFVFIDLATGGTEVEAPELKDLQLIYDPAQIETIYTWAGTWSDGKEPYEGTAESQIFLDNTLNNRARFQTEIERFFKKHDFITVDEQGYVTIGDDIRTQFEDGKATGKVTINTTYPFTEKSVQEYVDLFNKGSEGFADINLLLTLLNGTIQHKIDCEFTVTPIPDSNEYAVSYTGDGTYSFKGEIVDRVDGVNADNLGGPQHVTVDDITTREINAEGKVKLNYVVKIQ